MANIICGTLRKRKKFYFTFDIDSKILTIQPTKMNKSFSPFSEDYFDGFSYFKDYVDLEGETNQKVYIRFINVKFLGIGRGCFQAWVPAYIIGTVSYLTTVAKPNKINKITFRGECIDRFLRPNNSVKNIWSKDSNNIQVNVDYSDDKTKCFLYNECKFSLSTSWRTGTTPKNINSFLTSKSSLTVESEKTLDIKSIMDIYEKVEKLFSFTCYRQNVKFDSILLSQIDDVKLGDSIEKELINFELHISFEEDKYDLSRNNKNIVFEKSYIEKMPMLIKYLSKNDFIFFSFPKNSSTETIIDTNKYISISSAFESIFTMLKPHFKSLKDKNYNIAKKTTLTYLEKQKNNKEYNYDTRNYLNDFYGYIDKYEGLLEGKIQYALRQYAYIVEPDRKFFEKKYRNIDFSNYYLAKAFADKRNNLSHGGEINKFKKLEIAAYSIIRKVNYAMLLEKSGFNEKEIKDIIGTVF